MNSGAWCCLKNSLAVSRRSFLAGASAILSAPTISLGQTQRVFKIGLVGCGGRGSGAIKNIIDAAERLGHKAVLVSAADFFRQRKMRPMMATIRRISMSYSFGIRIRNSNKY